MIAITLSEAAQWSDALFIGQDVEVTGIAIDSRLVTPGSLFVAIKGKRQDGHHYIADAKARGACAVMLTQQVSTDLPVLLVNDVVVALGKLAAAWRRSHAIPVIGVLGSNGKTTVTQMIATILGYHYGTAVLATHGNQNNLLGVALTLSRLNAGHQAAVVEMGANHPGEITQLGAIVRPNFAVITNAGFDHVAGFGGIEGAAKANGEIFAAMADSGCAIINGDDACQRIWRSQLGKRAYVQFGFNPGVEVQGFWYPHSNAGEFLLDSLWGQIQCQLNLLGQHNVLNALAAAATCLLMGVSLDTIALGLAAMQPINGRLKPLYAESGALILDDTYNANPSSLQAALATLSALPGKHILVLGDMVELGDQAESWHTQAACDARTAGVELVFAVGELARFATRRFGHGAKHYTNIEALLDALQPELGSGINVLIKGSRCMGLERVVEKLL